MSSDNDENEKPEWDNMIQDIMEAIPSTLDYKSWQSLKETIHTTIWAYFGDLIDNAELQFSKYEETSIIRLHMPVGRNRIDFQKAFNTKHIISKSQILYRLEMARDVLNERIADLKKLDEEVD